ncbi:sacsin N-terminal ATP-binding-like domain-containing protein [Flavobacterium sp. LHD-85]|uniref:sacsin N-terminal ATP-binding-like domain-containing protein n=1 Tax=Flavobacterium sp. LHD-85 TaxID=3071410 RepID=UPI0027DF271E|nr:DUF3883 domain-containing protein [Flavobacterium sp. LHD-85]MDQ6531921.1 DUF3883 domain-containing protein [Flavobacterium sp. LHD-85]
MHKEFVDRIHNEKAKNDSNSMDLARTLNVLSKTVFGEVNRFVFELLQNADDSSSGEKEISVNFQLLENHLVFSHDGKHFSPEDVQGISGIGSRASAKDKNTEKTGYKGIGFKSVFGSSDYAHIVSGGFSFRFDRNYEGFANPEEYPWQVVPIWTDQPTAEISPYIDNERVNTIIGINSRENIRREIMAVFEDCQIILFLRKVKTVTLFDGDEKIFEVTKNPVGDTIELYKNGILQSAWIFKSMELAITETLSEKLAQLSDTECPQKLKDAQATKLTFATQVKDGRLAAVNNAVIYSYLPTKAEKKFPFLINGDFLTNAERTALMPNVWNEFLFTQIAARQLEWFKELQQTDYKFDVLKLLKGKYSGYSPSLIDAAYNKSLEAAAATIDFLPQQHKTGTTTISHAVLDSIGFSEYFHASFITNYMEVSDTHGVVDLRMESQTGLTALGAEKFDFSQVIDLVHSKVINDTVRAGELIRFFFNKTINNQNPSWRQPLTTAPFILDESGEFSTPGEIFFPSANAAADIDFSSLNYIHSSLLASYGENKDMMSWLQSLGVREPLDIEILRKAVLPMVKNSGITLANRLNLTRFIFKNYKSGQLSDQDYAELRGLHLLTANGMQLPARSYLSDQYRPDNNLTAVLPLANFVSEDYIENPEDITYWKQFLKRIGVRDSISVDLIEETVERNAFQRNHPEAAPYFSWLDSTTAYPSAFYPYRNSGQHYIQNFTAIEFRDHLLNRDFAKLFWTRTLENWDDFAAKCSKSVYYYYRGNTAAPSYIEYYFKNFDCIPCTDGICRKSQEVFAPSFKSIVGKHLPVADLPAAMTAVQTDFFAFKKQISPNECLMLLSAVSALPLESDTNRQLFSIYDQLISIPSQKVQSLRPEITQWKDTGHLLTIDNTFMPAGQLYIYAVQNMQAPMGTDRFLKTSGKHSRDEINALAEFFSIPIITRDMLEFVPIGASQDESLRQALLKRAAFIALIYSKKSTEKYLKILASCVAVFEKTAFINAETISLVYKDSSGVVVDSKIDCWAGQPGEFYFTGKWNSPLTIYSLSSSLSSLLKFENMEREFGLLMQLKPEDTFIWLKAQGYAVEEIDTQDELFSNHLDAADQAIASNDGTDPESPYTGIDVSFESYSERPFVPEVKVQDINFTNVTAVINKLADAAVNTGRTYEPITNSQVKIDIGRWSEEYVNQYLMSKPENFTEIIWHNETEESYFPYDFTVTENGNVRCIEVKGTPSMEKDMIKLSEGEWKKMFEHGSNYTIFRIYGAGSSQSRLERNDDIRSEIETGKLLKFPIDVFLP